MIRLQQLMIDFDSWAISKHSFKIWLDKTTTFENILLSSAYALVLSGNHVYTSGAPGTNGKDTIALQR